MKVAISMKPLYPDIKSIMVSTVWGHLIVCGCTCIIVYNIVSVGLHKLHHREEVTYDRIMRTNK